MESIIISERRDRSIVFLSITVLFFAAAGNCSSGGGRRNQCQRHHRDDHDHCDHHISETPPFASIRACTTSGQMVPPI